MFQEMAGHGPAQWSHIVLREEMGLWHWRVLGVGSLRRGGRVAGEEA